MAATSPAGGMSRGGGNGLARILVVQPDPRAGLDRFGPWLRDAALTPRVVRPFLGEPVPRSAASDDGLVVLGGSMSATDDAELPWLGDVKGLLRTAVAEEVPTLGICLGAQLLADALGGEVRRGEAGLESGVVEVAWCRAAADDDLLGQLPRPLLVGAMHEDAVVRLPEGAVLLGTGVTYPHQAFRIGRAWGVQFHPEISPQTFRGWREVVAPGLRDDFDARARRLAHLDDRVRAGAQPLAAAFGRVVHESARSRSRR